VLPHLYVVWETTGTHVNSISYDVEKDLIMLSYNTFSELIVIDHSTTTKEAKGHRGGRHGRGGDFLYRFGNPATMRGDHQKQTLFNQHNVHWIPDGSNPCVAGSTLGLI
jgi:hypothetical protein